jgi:tetratricopeptide (TPR) repeat protein
MCYLRPAAIFVFTIALAYAETPAPEEPQKSWAALHEAGFAAYQAKKFDEAITILEAALPLASDARQRAATLNDLGNCQRAAGRQAQGAEKLEQALAAWREVDARSRYAAQTAMSLANAQRSLNHYAAAEKTLRLALEDRPREDASQAALLNSLGDLLREEVRLVEARDLFNASLKLGSNVETNEIDALIGLADIERSMSAWRDSIDHWNRAIALSRQAGERATEAIALRGLGKTYSDMGDLPRAEPLLRRALPMFDAVPELRGQSAATLSYLGGVYRDEKKYALAEDAFTRALNLQGGFEHANGPQAGAILELLAGIYGLEKRFDEGARYAAAALRIMQTAFPPDSPPIAGAIGAQGFVALRAGDLAGADRYYSEALRIMRLNAIEGSTIGTDFMTERAQILRRLHRTQDAKSIETQIKAFRLRGGPMN